MPDFNLSRRDFLGASVAAGTLWAAGCAGVGIAAGAAQGEDAAAPTLKPLFFPVALSAGDGRHAMAKAAGFDCMVTSVDDCLCPNKSDAEFAKRLAQLRALPLPIRAANVFIPASLRITGPETHHEAILARAKIVFARAKQAGIGRIVFGSGKARQLPEGFPVKDATAQFTALLRQMGPLAQAQGVLVVPETLNRGECNFINTLPELTAIVAEVNHPAVRVNADLYHLRREKEDPRVLEAAIPWLALVEIAEVEKRTIPGVAGDDFRPFFRVLLKHRWSGMLNAECRQPTPEQAKNMFTTLSRQIRESAA